jgi:hypothetical protein
MINIDFFKKIRFNRCELLLNETESYYLYSKFHDLIALNESKDKVFSKTNIAKILEEFCNISETRYFERKDIEYISNYYIDMIKEEIGRGRESKLGDQITPSKVIYKLSGWDIDDAASTIKGSATGTEVATDSVAFIKSGVAEESIEVDDPDAAHVYLKNVEVNVISKI